MLEDFEHDKFFYYHQKILDDDGVPHLQKQMRLIAMDIQKLYDPTYKGPKHEKHSRENVLANVKKEKKRLALLAMEKKTAKID